MAEARGFLAGILVSNPVRHLMLDFTFGLYEIIFESGIGLVHFGGLVSVGIYSPHSLDVRSIIFWHRTGIIIK